MKTVFYEYKGPKPNLGKVRMEFEKKELKTMIVDVTPNKFSYEWEEEGEGQGI